MPPGRIRTVVSYTTDVSTEWALRVRVVEVECDG